MTRLQWLALVNALAVLLLVLISSLLRATGTEQACGEPWAWCNGAWLPEPGLGPVTAYGRGLVASLSLILVLATAVFTRRLTTSRRSRRIAWLAAGILVADLVLGRAVAGGWAPTEALVAGPVLTMTVLGLAFVLCWSLARDHGAPAWLARAGQDIDYPRDIALVWLTRFGVGALLMVIASGAITSVASASLPCPSWPLCAGDSVLPDQPGTDAWLHMAHRILTVVAAAGLFAITIRAWSRPSPQIARQMSLLTAAVLIVQILLGGNLVVAGGPAWLDLLHLMAGIVLWLAVITLAVVAPMPAGVPGQARAVVIAGGPSSGTMQPVTQLQAAGRPDTAAALDPLAGSLVLSLPDHRAVRVIVSDLIALTKPGILTLLLVTTFAAMLIAAAGLPPFALICVTIIGGVLAAGGANVLNCCIDRDIDAQMARTRHRATASNRIPLPHVLTFGVSLTVLSVVLLGIGANWVAALLALAGNLFYVLIYTKWLKRRTPQNIVIGGAAGAVPPLVGWAAVTGDLSPIAWMLFAIVFMWTPPHFWALALLKQGEYGRAAVPMLPVVAGEAETRRQIVIYSVLLFVVCLILVPLGLGPVYLVAAVLINAVFLGLALLLYRWPAKRQARRLFFWSLWYLALIFLAAVADRLILG